MKHLPLFEEFINEAKVLMTRAEMDYAANYTSSDIKKLGSWNPTAGTDAQQLHNIMIAGKSGKISTRAIKKEVAKVTQSWDDQDLAVNVYVDVFNAVEEYQRLQKAKLKLKPQEKSAKMYWNIALNKLSSL